MLIVSKKRKPCCLKIVVQLSKPMAFKEIKWHEGFLFFWRTPTWWSGTPWLAVPARGRRPSPPPVPCDACCCSLANRSFHWRPRSSPSAVSGCRQAWCFWRLSCDWMPTAAFWRGNSRRHRSGYSPLCSPLTSQTHLFLCCLHPCRSLNSSAGRSSTAGPLQERDIHLTG